MNRFLVLLLATAALASSGCTGFPEDGAVPGSIITASVVALDADTNEPLVWGLSTIVAADGTVGTVALRQAFDAILKDENRTRMESLLATNATQLSVRDVSEALASAGLLAKFGIPVTFALGSEQSGFGAQMEQALIGAENGTIKVIESRNDPTRAGYHKTVRIPQRLDVNPAQDSVDMNTFVTQISIEPTVGALFDLSPTYKGRVVAIESQSATPFVPAGPDSDGDGFTDAFEANLGTDPQDPADPAETDDTDQDGLSNGRERALGTDPANVDTDGDGLNDGSVTFRFDIAEAGQRDPADIVGAILLTRIVGDELVRDLEPDVGKTFDIQAAAPGQGLLGLDNGKYRTEGAEKGNLVYGYTPLKYDVLTGRAVTFHVEVRTVDPAPAVEDGDNYGMRSSPYVRGNPEGVDASHHHEGDHAAAPSGSGDGADHHDEPTHSDEPAEPDQHEDDGHGHDHGH